MKSDLALVFDFFETDLTAIDAARLKRVGWLGMLVGVPALGVGFVLSFMLFATFRVVNKLTLLPVGMGELLFATGIYRLGLGVVPLLVRSSFLRLLFLLVLLIGLFAATFFAYFVLFDAG